MQKPDCHILVCNSLRNRGEPQGVCTRKGASDMPQYLENEIVDRGLNAMVSTTSCFKMCEKGPIMVVYPQGWWIGEVDEEKIDAVLDAVEEGRDVNLPLLA